MNLIMKNIAIFSIIFLLTQITCPIYNIHAQEVQINHPGSSSQNLTTEVQPPELPPTPRSKLEIIQYILLPFAIGASIWLILRLEKEEREEKKEEQ